MNKLISTTPLILNNCLKDTGSEQVKVWIFKILDQKIPPRRIDLSF